MYGKALVLSLTILLQETICSNKNSNPTYSNGLFDKRLSEDGKLSFVGLSVKYGYPAEKTTVLTEDGYILSLYHIKGDTNRVVLLVHGNTVASDSWLIRGDTSLGITLAKQGYDVWAIDMRGTTESRKHLYIDPKSDKFQNYSFYEQGYYDIPATIDYILKDTNQTQLLAIGHSLGTTVFYVMGAERPEYNEKIKAFISLAPVSFLQNMKGLPEVIKTVKDLPKDIYAKLVKSKEEEISIRDTCLGPLGYELCVKQRIFLIFGPDEEGLEREFLPTIVGHYPVMCSKKVFKHLFQVVRRKKFAKYDYGLYGNMQIYNRTEPPEMDLSRIAMRVILMVGENDYLATVADAELLRSELPNVVHYQVMPYEKFNHADFIWGRYMHENLYPYLLPLIEIYSKISD